ncbi:hypothetical protein EYF80_004482 [Liparis tanakae]|uniref:Uncharacterized protein n=1 Tax=Liparis tanakae TaxID=230148 RepID=A0A4Z2J6L9_9TELE|nr:hypothetical protein EYF80_004482 [Liparis tanakae]
MQASWSQGTLHSSMLLPLTDMNKRNQLDLLSCHLRDFHHGKGESESKGLGKRKKENYRRKGNSLGSLTEHTCKHERPRLPRSPAVGLAVGALQISGHHERITMRGLGGISSPSTEPHRPRWHREDDCSELLVGFWQAGSKPTGPSGEDLAIRVIPEKASGQHLPQQVSPASPSLCRHHDV